MADLQNKYEKYVAYSADTGAMDINQLVNSTTPPEFILKLLIIQKREDFHSSIDQYTKAKVLHQVGDLSKVRARLLSLFLQLRSSLQNHYKSIKKEEEFKQLEKDVRNSNDFDTLYDAGCIIEDYLYLKKVIKFDNDKFFAPGDLEGRNKESGYM